ncbi:MAG: 2-aminoethylphosphonate--pyruvate transaminase [Cellulosilyticaceae bacterium]
MNTYKLLTPGPLTTTDTVKQQMLMDRCTWDDDYKQTTQEIRRELLAIAEASEETYTTVLMQGSGSFAVEAVLTTALGKNDKCLFITNGAYGERMVSMAECMGANYVVCDVPYNRYPEVEEIKGYLEEDLAITHIAMVHCETTTGILNPLEEVCELARTYGKTIIIDAMSSFGGVPIAVEALGIDFLISSANKCIQGVPGFGFVLAKKQTLIACKGQSRSLCLDLYDQWVGMDKDGKWRYTSPTHVVAAFRQAIEELKEEGGVAARYTRYAENNQLLREKLSEIGITSYIEESIQSPIITTFLFPCEGFDFDTFYHYIKQRGFVIYPGKLTDVDTFRMGNIGEIYKEDVEVLCQHIKTYMEEYSA